MLTAVWQSPGSSMSCVPSQGESLSVASEREAKRQGLGCESQQELHVVQQELHVVNLWFQYGPEMSLLYTSWFFPVSLDSMNWWVPSFACASSSCCGSPRTRRIRSNMQLTQNVWLVENGNFFTFTLLTTQNFVVFLTLKNGRYRIEWLLWWFTISLGSVFSTSVIQSGANEGLRNRDVLMPGDGIDIA